MDKMVVFQYGDTWKALRHGLSPTFTTGRLRAVVPAMSASRKDFIAFVDRKNGDDTHTFDMKDVACRFGLSVIARAVFGVDAKAFDEEDSEFVKNARLTQPKMGFKQFMVFMAFVLFPKRLLHLFGVTMMDYTPFKFFIRVVEMVVKDRRSKEGRSNDMLQVRDKICSQMTQYMVKVNLTDCKLLTL